MLCRLCGGPGPLRDSHILPEFVYKPTYDSTHTAIVYDLDANRKGAIQKGLREELFCDACEGRFGKWEHYFAEVWLHPLKSIRPATIPNELIQISGLDYAKFKLFHMSLIWRASVSSLDAFRNVSLGGQEARVGARLLRSDPGTLDNYPFFGMALRDPDTGGFKDDLLRAPTHSRVDGHHVYSLVFGGVEWFYFYSGHSTAGNSLCTFSSGGELHLAVQDWTENRGVQGLASRIQVMLKRGAS